MEENFLMRKNLSTTLITFQVKTVTPIFKLSSCRRLPFSLSLSLSLSFLSLSLTHTHTLPFFIFRLLSQFYSLSILLPVSFILFLSHFCWEFVVYLFLDPFEVRRTESFTHSLTLSLTHSLSYTLTLAPLYLSPSWSLFITFSISHSLNFSL